MRLYRPNHVFNIAGNLKCLFLLLNYHCISLVVFCFYCYLCLLLAIGTSESIVSKLVTFLAYVYTVCCSAASLAVVVHLESETESRQTSTADDNASETECKKQSDRHLTLKQRKELAVNASLSKAVVTDPAVDAEKSQLAL